MAWREGLYYSNARWYDPTLGRFITEDPARAGIDWYAYCDNNPLVNIDPTGLGWLNNLLAKVGLAKSDEQMAIQQRQRYNDIYGSMFNSGERTILNDEGLYSQFKEWNNAWHMRDPALIPTGDELFFLGAGDALKLGATGLKTFTKVELLSSSMSAGLSGAFSFGASLKEQGGAAFTDPAVYGRAAIAMGFGFLSGPLNKGIGSGLPFGRASPWIGNALGSAIAGMGAYETQSGLFGGSPTAGNVLTVGAINALTGTFGKSVGELTSYLGGSMMTTGTGTYVNPFTGVLTSPNLYNDLQVMSTSFVKTQTATNVSAIVVDPLVSTGSQAIVDQKRAEK